MATLIPLLFQSPYPACEPSGVDELTSMGLPNPNCPRHHRADEEPKQPCRSAQEVAAKLKSDSVDLNILEIKSTGEQACRSACSGQRSPRSSLNGVDSSVVFLDDDLDIQKQHQEMSLSSMAAIHVTASPLLRYTFLLLLGIYQLFCCRVFQTLCHA